MIVVYKRRKNKPSMDLIRRLSTTAYSETQSVRAISKGKYRVTLMSGAMGYGPTPNIAYKRARQVQLPCRHPFMFLRIPTTVCAENPVIGVKWYSPLTNHETDGEQPAVSISCNFFLDGTEPPSHIG